eukprot:TRINITY_DN1656_c0_g1_i1.p1 TRINITY_DN1656_c0_g1~~TRINITY_DN1656_c0_g1_i1.p1  ORF type:complete len:323 (-),score=18.56 TRINITY_DN1656_c0_g1_i1:71-1039(-)
MTKDTETTEKKPVGECTGCLRSLPLTVKCKLCTASFCTFSCFKFVKKAHDRTHSGVSVPVTQPRADVVPAGKRRRETVVDSTAVSSEAPPTTGTADVTEQAAKVGSAAALKRRRRDVVQPAPADEMDSTVVGANTDEPVGRKPSRLNRRSPAVPANVSTFASSAPSPTSGLPPVAVPVAVAEGDTASTATPADVAGVLTEPPAADLSAGARLGRNKSGRWWRPDSLASAPPTSMIQSAKISAPYESRMKDRRRKQELQSLKSKVSAIVDAEREKIHQARAARRLYRERNKESATVFTKIRNVRKLKKLSHKQILKARIKKMF